MRESYSLYEAKAKLSAIVRRVREGVTVLVTLHGKPVAEIRPVEPEPETLEERIARLTERGEIVPAGRRGGGFRVGKRKPGALKRFLEDRNK